MQYLNARYAEWFNWRHGYRGHLFQGRFWSELVDTERYLAEVARYIALNPLRAGLCRDPLDWPWSSYAATIGLGPAPDFLTCEWLLELFGSSLNNARAAYRSFVSQAAPVIHRDVSGV
jgi:hypothetical protein